MKTILNLSQKETKELIENYLNINTRQDGYICLHIAFSFERIFNKVPLGFYELKEIEKFVIYYFNLIYQMRVNYDLEITFLFASNECYKRTDFIKSILIELNK